MDNSGPTDRHIQILLAEYNTLRSEIIQRGSWQIQMWAIAVTSAVALLGFAIIYHAVWSGLFLLIIALALMGSGLLFNDQGIQLIAAQIKELEERINNLAHAKLLSWQGRGGLATIGYRKRIRRIIERFVK